MSTAAGSRLSHRPALELGLNARGRCAAIQDSAQQCGSSLRHRPAFASVGTGQVALSS